jgi:hypothetical protein
MEIAHSNHRPHRAEPPNNAKRNASTRSRNTVHLVELSPDQRYGSGMAVGIYICSTAKAAGPRAAD